MFSIKLFPLTYSITSIAGTAVEDAIRAFTSAVLNKADLYFFLLGLPLLLDQS